MYCTLRNKLSGLVSTLELNILKKTAIYYSSVPLQDVDQVSSKQVTPENQHECLAQVVTPLWQMPYRDQLRLKLDRCYKVLQMLRLKMNSGTKTGKRKRLNCKIHHVIRSPVTEGYRNKDEFSIQTGIDGNPKTVGFFVGSPAEGPVVCVRGTHLINMKESHKKVAQVYEDYVRSSPLPACLDLRDGGHWRNLLVRSNEEGQVMATAMFHPQDMEPERIDEEANKLRDYFLHGPGSCCNLTSLYFQPCRHTRCTADQAPFKLLFGDTHLVEKLNEFKFQISPDSFFQVNTAAAALLYNKALEMAHLTSMTTLLDVYCGTGTMSLLASRQVRGAVGIESVYSAVTDARNNALLNKINNAEFIPGLAEKKLPRVIAELDMASDIVTILNPGRSGCHSHVIKALCCSPQIKNIIYISCKPDNPNTLSNFMQLCSEGKFSLDHVVGVDMFPHTYHTELILSFSR